MPTREIARQVRKETRAERLCAQLAEDIVAGLLGPATRLDEQTLADRFGVSRTPVREALRQLASTGLVEIRPHRGVVVTSVTRERLDQMFEAMAELEAACARMAAERMTAAEHRTLAELHAASAPAVADGDVTAYQTFNRELHNAIYAGSRNAVIVELTLDTRRRLAPFRQAQFRLPDRMAASFAEHAAVVAAIAAGDAGGAYRAMRTHLGAVGLASADGVMRRADSAAAVAR